MPTVSSPPENLVIYEVRGDWEEPERLTLGPDFLGFWVESGYTFFFFGREADGHMRPFLAERPGLEVRCVHRMKYAEWQDGAAFAPFRVGSLTIVPAWASQAEDAGPAVIRIDPGLAFGFGGHPTTLACLKALVRVYREDRPGEVLDLGAGTGILALAAARLGADRVLAVEYSHMAADTARRNAVLNALENRIEVVRGRAEAHCAGPAQLVCSNLHLAVQEAVLSGGGFDGRRWLILSGLFHEQAAGMESALAEKGYRLIDRVRDERWATLLLRGRD